MAVVIISFAFFLSHGDEISWKYTDTLELCRSFTIKGPFKQMCIRIQGIVWLSVTLLGCAIYFQEIPLRKNQGDIGRRKISRNARF